MNKYESIINLPHHVSKYHKRMTMESRAAQFAPFSALTGYEDAIKETARLTNHSPEFDEDLQNNLNTKLDILAKNINLRPLITITYFVKDLKKDGGKYITENHNLKKIDKIKGELMMMDNKIIKFNEIINIDSNLFKFN